jgi:hypothetical protein
LYALGLFVADLALPAHGETSIYLGIYPWRRADSNRRPPACKATTAGSATCGDTQTHRSPDHKNHKGVMLRQVAPGPVLPPYCLG